MKKGLIITIATLVTVFLLGSSLVLARWGGGQRAQGNNRGNPAAMIATLPYEELSAAEKSSLLKMVEEEKLARDVYLALYDKWAIPAFSNISRSEQRHMDAVAALLAKYNLANPVANLAPGNFATPEVQTLYGELVANGSTNNESALRVGATIEDLDIKDLKEALAETDNQDITLVFGNLKRGSENHLRAFTSLLSMYGFDPYEAQYLSPQEIDEILSTPPTRGPGRGRGGNRRGNCQLLEPR
jgi:hypothetical protein